MRLFSTTAVVLCCSYFCGCGPRSGGDGNIRIIHDGGHENSADLKLGQASAPKPVEEEKNPVQDFLSASEAPTVDAQGNPFPVNPHRRDPYKNYKFRVRWDGQYIPGIVSVSPLKRSTEPIVNRPSDDPNVPGLSVGQTTFAPITIERGITHDKSFEQWANKVWNYGGGLGNEVSLKDFRKDVIIEIMNEAGQVAIAYKVFRCWVSEFEAFSTLNAKGKEVLMQRITIVNEGWDRDYDVAEPTEPSYQKPN